MNNYATHKEIDQLTIIHKSGYVSWKSPTYPLDAGQVMQVYKDGASGVALSIEEWYTADKAREVNKKTYIHLEEQQIDELIEQLQALKAKFKK